MMELEDGWLEDVFKKAKKAMAEIPEEDRSYNEAHFWDGHICAPTKPAPEKPLFDSY